MYEAILFQGDRIIREQDDDLRTAVVIVFRRYYDPSQTGVGGSFPARMVDASIKTMMEIVKTCDPAKHVVKSLPKKSDELLVLLMVGQPSGFVRPL